ncbi:alanine/glycine:cation symporter family protein [Rothia nasimurium]|uniref:alanine/glycine:cation symporter family protein n=1 Tax=Rothia nasimurium TaxID=85336 RepID=UPI001F298151|nr:sodium:alanine symporter family protein [Rothia nasimurium]
MTLQDILSAISSLLWGPFVLIPLLLGTGIYLTIRLGFIQLTKLAVANRLAFLERKDEDAPGGDISQFQSLTTALAATVGTGNIVGVATAISIGGPGALFWMWLTALFGMASKYSEAFLGVRFRTTDAKGEISGGPQYYLERGIKGPFGKFLALFFAVAAVLASFGIGNTAQGNSIAHNLEDTFHLPTGLTGIVLAIITLFVLMGGIKSIGKVTAGFVPVMILFYVGGALYILSVNASAIPGALGQIFSDAFTGTSAVGGFAGASLMYAVQYGVARGIFSNESGMGSAAIAAAAAQTTHPVRQGLVSMTQTFIDTMIVVSCTGLVLVVTGMWQATDASGEQIPASVMTSQAFASVIGPAGSIIVTVGLVLFAYSTILGWAYYGERNIERLVGRRGVTPYRLFFAVVIYFGCTMDLSVAWTFSDIANGLMAIPNLIGLLLMSGLIVRETKYYLANDPQLTASKSDIDAFMEGKPGAIDSH